MRCEPRLKDKAAPFSRTLAIGTSSNLHNFVASVAYESVSCSWDNTEVVRLVSCGN